MINKMRKSLIIIGISIIALLLGSLVVDAGNIQYNDIDELKNDYSGSSQIDNANSNNKRRIKLGYPELNSKLTVWCIENGQDLAESQTYRISKIVNIGNAYVGNDNIATKDTYKYAEDVKSGKGVSNAANARLAYIIEANKSYNKSGYDLDRYYPPQLALWKYFDNWVDANDEIFDTSLWECTDTWEDTGAFTTNQNKARRILANSLTYSQFAKNYKGKINDLNKNKVVTTVTKSGNYYYAGPIQLNFSYYNISSYSGTDSYKNYRTLEEIGNLTSIKNGNTSLKVTKSVGGDVVDINTIKPNDKFYIRLSSISDQLNVTVTQSSFDLISARLWLLRPVGTSAQRLMVSASSTNEVSGTDLKTTFKIKTTDVSLQKYIRKVTDSDGNEVASYPDTATNTRHNRYADTDEKLGLTDKNHQGYNISKNNSTTGANNYKSKNPVVIEAGDTVEYNITVYNNSTTSTIVKVRDGLWPVINGNATIASTGAWLNGNKTSETIEFKRVSGENYYDIYVNGSNTFTLNGGDYRTFKISLTYTKYVSGVQINTAWISETSVHNRKGYRTYDREYIQMKQYSVSLEKFVSKVGTANITGRNNKRFNDELAVGNVNRNDWKYNNPQKVELGDEITYTIRLKNTGTTKLKISQIYDSFTFGDSVKLSYISITGNGGGTIADNSYDGPNNNWDFEGLNRYLIKFNNPTLLDQGNSVDVTITFKLEQVGSITNYVRTAFNKAKIVEIKNANNVVIGTDADGTDNNADKDYVGLKDYKVSLEKFVSEVTDANGGNKQTYDDRSGKRYNESLKDGDVNKNVYKKDHKVQVESGDKVTFTIRLKNTGDNPVKISQIYDSFRFEEEGKANGLKLVYDSSYGIKGNGDGTITNYHYLDDNDNNNKKLDRYLIQFNNATLLNKDEYVDVTIRYTVEAPAELTDLNHVLQNKAGIVQLMNQNNKAVSDSDGTDNNYDMDWVQIKQYKVSLQKIVSSVNNGSTGSSFNRWNSWENKANENPSKTGTAYEKYNNPVEVANGDTVTYAIKVKNDGTTQVKNIEIQDTLPTTGMDTSTFKVEDVKKYNSSGSEMTNDITTTTDSTKLTLTGALNSQESVVVYVSVTVTESNMSLNVLRNYAEINAIQNRNDVNVKDSTPNDNQDADYIQMKDIVISGTVWNDVALNKTQDNYNGKYDNTVEKKLGDIKVYLYRQGTNSPIATTFTDNNNSEENRTNYGTYSFALDYIKGPKATGTNRWEGTYYSYYVVFEYDGVTYTSTKFADVTSNNPLDSNAREILDSNTFGEPVDKNRTDFNNSFNPNSGIEYATKNESGYIPQSIHEYNPSTMAIQSSTMLISLSNNEALEQQLKHVNLGLRGRDIFDLELTSDVYSTKVKVNKQEGAYNFNSNKVTVRESDISVVEDAANIASEARDATVSEVNQGIRKLDIQNNNYDVDEDGKKGDTGLGIEVTYKITVTNASRTDGTATKITNYYDSKYEFVKAYSGASNLTTTHGESGTNFESIIIETPETNLSQGQSMEIYVVYRLKNASTTLSVLLGEGEKKLATFNMAEITEYKTYATSAENEYTRGLLDKDSKPGSANTEQVRLTTTEGQNTATVDGNPTTVEYYFGGNDLSKLKYEDDTYATPTLYFVTPFDDNGTPDNKNDDNYYNRTITGTVFEDTTTTNPTTRIKTGNGKLDEGEVGVYGATVELVELETDKAPQDIAENEGTVRYTKQTDKDGKFTISGFLPGYYVIRYRYGDTTNTVLLHQGGENINKQSYNGEDYQSTNNAFEVKDTNGNIISNILDRSKGNLWYVMNKDKGISTATDNSTERTKVSDYVTGFTDEKMTVLNNMRDMIGTYSEDNNGTLTANRKYNINKTEIVEIPETKVTGINEVKEQTKMFATTPKMLFTVEQTINLNELGDKKQALIESQKITVNPDDKELGVWAMFPDANNEHYKNYLIENMNFGIAEVPVTTIDLQKTVQAFNLTDSTGKNTIASVVKNDSGKWELKGDVIAPDGATSIDVSVEDEKLQGAKLQVTYAITSKIDVEKNFDGKEEVYATITELVDYIDNNLSYNPALGENSKYWELTTYNDIFTDDRKGTVDPEGKKYTTIVKAKSGNPILNSNGGTATITLEKILSSTDSTIEEIITSTVEAYEYSNIVEITGISYENIGTIPPIDPDPTLPRKDLVRTEDGYIIVPTVQHDTETAEIITIHPPTGDSSISIMYYVIAVISLVVLAAGVFGIKKFVLTNRKS